MLIFKYSLIILLSLSLIFIISQRKRRKVFSLQNFAIINAIVLISLLNQYALNSFYYKNAKRESYEIRVNLNELPLNPIGANYFIGKAIINGENGYYYISDGNMTVLNENKLKIIENDTNKKAEVIIVKEKFSNEFVQKMLKLDNIISYTITAPNNSIRPDVNFEVKQ